MASRWTLEQVRAMQEEPVPDELMKRMLDANRADGWMLRLAMLELEREEAEDEEHGIPD